MSRAGRRARRARLITSGTWTPETDTDRAALLLAERARWVRDVGWVGWHAEVTRRRAARIAVMRSQRLERSKQRPPDPTLPLIRAAAQPADRKAA